MTKQKTRKSAASRFRVTKNKKVLHRSPFARHLRSKKSKSQLRRLMQIKQVAGKAQKKLLKMLGF